MLSDLWFLPAIAYITYCGTICIKRTLRLNSEVLAVALGLPIGLGMFTLLVMAMQKFLSLTTSSIIALGLMLVAIIYYHWSRYNHPQIQELAPEDSPEPFGMFTLIIFGAFFILSLYALHLGQLSSLPPDFLGTFPYTRVLLKGSLAFEAPFFPAHPYTGNLGHAVLTAILAPALNGDIIRTKWFLQALLLADNLLIWLLALRLLLRRALPAALATVLLFWQLATPAILSNAAITYSTLLDTAVVGAMWVVYLKIFEHCKHHWKADFPACFVGGGLTFFGCMVCPPLAITMFLAFWIQIGIYCYRRRSIVATLLRCAVAITVSFLIWGTTQLPVWEHMALLKEHHLLQIHVPSRHFLQIAQNASSFGSQGPLYASLFSLSALKLHALSFWCALPLLVWALWRKSPKGLMLWGGGIVMFLMPGVIECEARGALSQWYWEAAADALFAILLGYAIGDIYQLWSRKRSPLAAHLQRLTLFAIMVVCVAPFGWNVFKGVQNFPPCAHRSQYIYSPLYPPTAQWLREIPKIALSTEEEAVANWLWNSQDKPKRALFALSNLAEDPIEHIALLAGTSGCLPIGNRGNILLEQRSIDEFLPAPGTLAFLGQRRLDALLGLGAQIVICPAFSPTASNDCGGLTLLHKLSASVSPQELAIYRVEGSFPWDKAIVPCPTPDISIEISGLPQPNQVASGTAYTAQVKSNKSLQGWLRPMWHNTKNRWIDAEYPLISRIDGTSATIPFVYPYRTGRFQLSWLYYSDALLAQSSDNYEPLRVQRLAGSTPLEQQFTATLEKSLRLVKVNSTTPDAGTVIISNNNAEELNVGTNLRLRWRIWSNQSRRYKSHRITAASIPLPLKPGQTIELPWHTDRALNSDEQLDFSVGAPFGETYPLTRQ